MRKRRYAIRLAYHGAPFRGFPRQPGLATVQQALEEALAGCGIPASLAVAARTDAGVHALDQVVSFAHPSPLDTSAVRGELNRALPPAITCLELREVPHSFHARASARSRRYVYLVGSPPPEGLAPYAWALPDPRAFPDVGPRPLDVAAMRGTLQAAVGVHDFAPFARQGAPRNTVRELLRAEVLSAATEPIVAVVLEGGGFLRAMVRNLVGTAVKVGLGLAPETAVADILAAGGRYRGVRAPGWGLTLAAVTYPSPPWEPEPPPGPA